MSVAIDFDDIDKSVREKSKKSLILKPRKSNFDPNPAPIKLFAKNSKERAVYVPLGRYKDYFNKFPHNASDYTRTELDFCGDLYTAKTDPSGRGRDQTIVIKEAIQKLKETQTTFLACYTGFGKTASAVSLMCHFKLKTAVMCHLDVVKGQWPDEISLFTGGKAKVQIVRGKKPLDPDADVYIIGITKAATIPRSELVDIGMVIYDEAHLCTKKACSVTLLRFQPMYLVGLSATPDRADGLQKLLYCYFGPKRNFIFRHETKDFTVIKYLTRYTMERKLRVFRGRVRPDWIKMLGELARNKDRHAEIGDIAISHPEHKIIILCDRQITSKSIFKYLVERGEDVELFVGTKKKWDKSKRILVVGIKKGGVGLNDPDLTMEILEADVKDVRQYEGRIRTTNNLVYDIVDHNTTCENHWEKREIWYTKKGATITIKNARNTDEKE